jgi:hypothetical protein
VSRVAAKLAYKPVGIALGAAAGAVSGAVFRQVWRRVGGSDQPPRTRDENREWLEILLAAAFQGAIFAVVKAATDRAARVGVRRALGDWPS